MKHSILNNTYYRFAAIVLTCVLSTSANAEWALDSARSSLQFVSIKSHATGEVHHFKELTGSLSDKNVATVTINLNSVETGIQIRNERMQATLFETVQFPLATITTKVNTESLEALSVGAVSTQALDLAITLHGQTKTYPSHIQIIKLDKNTLMATTAAPIIVNAADFTLVAGIEKLRELAGLPAIATAVPVTASLVFKALP